jgi:hypothetical protein
MTPAQELIAANDEIARACEIAVADVEEFFGATTSPATIAVRDSAIAAVRYHFQCALKRRLGPLLEKVKSVSASEVSATAPACATS